MSPVTEYGWQVCQLGAFETFEKPAKLEVITPDLHNGVHRAGFLTETTVDAFRHVNVVACCSAAAVSSWLRLDCDCLEIWSTAPVQFVD